MCTPSWELVRIATEGRARLAARLPDGRLLDLQAAHIVMRGRPSPHLRDAVSLRMAASYGMDLLDELVAGAPSEAMV